MADNFPTIPGYRIERLLGSGGMAEVFLAIEEGMLGRPVAIKITHRALGVDETFARRFVLEARATASLKHTNIVSVYAADELDGRSWMAMEYVAGGTLRERTAQGNLTHDEIGRLLTDICAGLEAAHEQGYVHRDIKPENILLDPSGTAMVSDFGIVKVIDQSTKLTRTTDAIGTPHYMSPEQILNAPVDRRSDLYSLGVVLYELLEGKVPFDAAPPVAVHYKHVHEPPPKLSKRNARFQKLVNRLLAKESQTRPAKASEVAREYNELLSGSSAKVTAKPSRSAPAETARSQAAAKPRRPNRRARSDGGSQTPEMVVVPPGEFEMGDLWGDGSSGEQPVHSVHISNPFAIGRYPVTFDEYDRFAEASGGKRPDDGDWGRGRRPVINVSWEDARDYAQWLSEQTGKRFRLPSEAEWEYAARSGGHKLKWPGTSDEAKLAAYAWFDANSGGRTRPVGEKSSNGLKLHDMAGNVWEWVQDRWHGNYDGAPEDGRAWEEGDEAYRVLRGGSWFDPPGWLRCSARDFDHPIRRGNFVGFRLAQDL